MTLDIALHPELPAGKAVYAALDLGSNNCRLLVAKPEPSGFRVIDAFSRIVRLGEGVAETGHLSDAAMARTLAALWVRRTRCARVRHCRGRQLQQWTGGAHRHQRLGEL